MPAVLSFEQAPPLPVTFRFFLAAPWFGVAAGLLLALAGGAALESRWTPAALALTHLLGAGLLLQAMCGALLQILPVVAGVNVWRPALVSRAAQPALAAGALALAAGLYWHAPQALLAAQVLLGCGLAFYCATCAAALAGGGGQGPTRAALPWALLGLGGTAVLGLGLAQGLRGAADPWLASVLAGLLELHVGFGLAAWCGVLLAGVSFTVVPMFQRTPEYPGWMQRTVPAGILGSLLLRVLAGAGALGQAAELAVCVLLLVFAGGTLWLQARRRRARADATTTFFRVAMGALVGACVLLAARRAGWEPPWAGAVDVEIGVLALAGGYVSAVQGMLYKILPFIAWLQLPSRRGLPGLRVTVESFLEESAMRRQMRAHFAALVLLALAPWQPWLARPAGLAFAGSCAWLGWALAGVARRQAAFSRRIRAAAAAPAP